MKKTTPKKSKGTELKKKLDAVIHQLKNAGYDVRQHLFIHTTDDICHMIKSGRYEDARVTQTGASLCYRGPKPSKPR